MKELYSTDIIKPMKYQPEPEKEKRYCNDCVKYNTCHWMLNDDGLHELKGYCPYYEYNKNIQSE